MSIKEALQDVVSSIHSGDAAYHRTCRGSTESCGLEPPEELGANAAIAGVHPKAPEFFIKAEDSGQAWSDFVLQCRDGVFRDFRLFPKVHEITVVKQYLIAVSERVETFTDEEQVEWCRFSERCYFGTPQSQRWLDFAKKKGLNADADEMDALTIWADENGCCLDLHAKNVGYRVLPNGQKELVIFDPVQ